MGARRSFVDGTKGKYSQGQHHDSGAYAIDESDDRPRLFFLPIDPLVPELAQLFDKILCQFRGRMR